MKGLIVSIIFLFLVKLAPAQTVITFDDQNWTSDQILTSEFCIDNFSFSSNEHFYTNYGYNFDVNKISLYYVFQNSNTVKITISDPNGNTFKLISLAAYQVSEVSTDSLVIEGWYYSTLKYSRSFANDFAWAILKLNYDNINKVVIRLDSAGSGGLTDYNFDNFTFDYATLPVEITSFKAGVYNNYIKLNWTTATELNSYGFEVQRLNPSLNPVQEAKQNEWVKIGFIEGSGISNSPKFYSFIDSTVHNGWEYSYRLKQIDEDGNYKYTSQVNIIANLKLQSFILNQNYPNPFNPVTTIKYSLPDNEKVILKVYNVTGREVADLINQQQNAGNYSVQFNGSEYSSGVYFYRLTTNQGTQEKKMILLK